MIEALLWDVDGTLAETERDGHRVAYNRAFEDVGSPWRWSEERYGELLRVSGGYERLLHDMTSRTDAPGATSEREALARRVHARKNERYVQAMREQGTPLREGVRELIDECRARGVRNAIVTTSSRVNVEALLARHFGSDALAVFSVCVCAEDVRAKKPDPEGYLTALERLALSPLRCLVIEDSPGGVAAARAAGIPVVVTRSAYFAHDAIEDVLAVGPGLHTREGWHPACELPSASQRIGLDDLADWHSRMAFVSAYDDPAF